MGCWAQRIKKKIITPKLATEKIHLQRCQCICSFFYSEIPACVRQCWACLVFDLNQRSFNRCLVVGGEREGTQVSVSCGYKQMVVWKSQCQFFLSICALLPVPEDRATSAKQKLALLSVRCPTSHLTCRRCLGREDTKKNLAQMPSVLQITHAWKSKDLL